MTALGLGGFMVGLSPQLALLALVEVPLTIATRKVYDARYQVTAGAGWDRMGWRGQGGDRGGGMVGTA